MVEKLVIFCPLYKSSKTYNPKAEEVEKNIKLNIIFNFKAESIGRKEAQLLIKSEIKIMNRNFSYLKLKDTKLVSDSKFKINGNKNRLWINL